MSLSNKQLQGKKLLLLAGNLVGTDDIIKYARVNGVYTIVTDYLPFEKSFGKPLADESWDISTADVDTLKNRIIENKIDGVFAGVGEFNILKAMELCHSMGFHFYCTKEQWDLIENKESFRKLCEKYNVPCPRTYLTGSDVPGSVLNTITYPVIVKPVDASSSIGITICRDDESLRGAISVALKSSEKGRIIIEEFFEGEEFTAHYTIVNGKVSLSCIDNRVPVAVHSGSVTTIPVARIYPSSFINEYIDQVNNRMIELCESLDLTAGVLFVQGLYNRKQNKFSIFEAGLRCAGEAAYRITEKVNGNNFMNLFVDYSLLGKTDNYRIENDDPFMKGKMCCVTSFVSIGGIIGKIIGYEDALKTVPSIISSECRYHEGDTTPDGDTLRQIVLRFTLVCDSKEQMINDIECINQKVAVLNDKGEDMCLKFNARNYYNIQYFGSI